MGPFCQKPMFQNLILTFICPQFAAENHLVNNDGNPTIFSLMLLKHGWNDILFLYIVEMIRSLNLQKKQSEINKHIIENHRSLLKKQF